LHSVLFVTAIKKFIGSGSHFLTFFAISGKRIFVFFRCTLTLLIAGNADTDSTGGFGKGLRAVSSDLANSETERNESPFIVSNRFSWLVDRLLILIGEIAVERDALNTSEFRTKLTEYRDEFAGNGTGISISESAESCLALCEKYFRQARGYEGQREIELNELLSIFQHAITELSGDSSEYSAEIQSSSDKFSKLIRIDDIRELKRRISEEVGNLKHLVVEQQRKEAATHAKLSQQVDRLQAKLQQLKTTSRQDSLTSVANRRTFDEELARRVAECHETKKHMVLAMLDIDDFKKINDIHGHPVGDAVIAKVAKVLSSYVRAGDIVARYGGEEFAILYDDTTAAQVEPRVTNLIVKVAGAAYEYERGPNAHRVNFTISCGLAELAPNEAAADLLNRADEALYEAKHTGKNRVVIKRRPFWNMPFVNQ